MQFGKAFTYVFEDDDWIMKTIIAALVSLIPIIGQITVVGWGLEVTRRIIREDPNPLPDWSDFGGHIVKGIITWVIGFVYALPIILVWICPVIIIVAFPEDETVVSLVSVCFGCLTFLYAVLLMFVLPAALGNYAAKDELSAAFRFGEVFGLVRAAPGAYLLTILGAIIASVIIGPLGIILCVVGVLWTQAYAILINAHLWGQAYNEAQKAEILEPVEV
ncbi:MAG: DUF4013 domain-containing protein [Anaerolineales bacterium]|nr:DUF4013 domain-containing protein [Anaerolineales bacterium]